LEKAALEFQKILGRKPGPKDPVVFNHWLTGEEDFWQHAKDIGRAAKIPEQLIFAWRRSACFPDSSTLTLLASRPNPQQPPKAKHLMTKILSDLQYL
jgi:hypothetical protein